MNPLASGILSTAKSIGMNPQDLATIISYETAGTFDPMKAGPTTQWGQHKGLIQFGEPQAQQYGVDWNDPVGSQLGENGAVARYFTQNGWKPGMGLLDAYSIVNAGAPGRYNASDANNGGAPGTVADKVNNQFGPHREKAAALLGEQPMPTGTPFNPAMSSKSPMMPPQPTDRAGDIASALAVGFNELRGSNRSNAIPAQAELRAKRSADAQQKNRTAEWLASQGRDDLAQAVMNGSITGRDAFGVMTAQPEDDRTALIKNYEFARENGFGGSFQDFLTNGGAGGTSVNVNTGDAANTGPQIGTIPQGYQAVQNPQTLDWEYKPISGGPEDVSSQNARKESNAATASETVTTAAQRAREAASGRNAGSAGTSLIGKINPYSDSAEVMRQVDVLKSQAKIGNLQAMRDASPTGGALGAVTAPELQMLADQSGALDPNSPNFERDLADYERVLLRTIHGREEGDKIFAATRTGASDDGWTEVNGVRIREKR